MRDTGRGEFYFAVDQPRPANPPRRFCRNCCTPPCRTAVAEIDALPGGALRWVRPLVRSICLFDGAILPLPLDEVPVGRTTRGHRFLSPGEIAVDNAADYLEKLEAAYVVLDQGDGAT